MNGKFIIDGHAHACGEYLTPETITQKLDAAKVDMVLLTPGQYGSKKTYGLKRLAESNPLGDVVSHNNRITGFIIPLIGAIKQIPKGNEYVYKLKCAMPSRVKQCYWVTKDNLSRLQQDYDRMHFDTIKLHQCWERFDIDDNLFIEAVEWAAAHQLPLFIHVRDLVQMRKVIAYIRKHPDVIIVIGHLYGVELFIQEDISSFSNTYFDLSNSYFVSKERTMMAYEHFGAGHLLMGSDTPYGKCSLEHTIQQISSLEISSEDRDRILGLNLAEILKINDREGSINDRLF